MASDSLSLDDLRDLIHKGDITDPLVYLEGIMSGKDLRTTSEIYDLACDINDFSDGHISKGDWNEVFNLITATSKYSPVSRSDSIAASKTLAEYLHAKKKNIELTTIDNKQDAHECPLTEDEVLLFREKFNDEF